MGLEAISLDNLPKCVSVSNEKMQTKERFMAMSREGKCDNV